MPLNKVTKINANTLPAVVLFQVLVSYTNN